MRPQRLEDIIYEFENTKIGYVVGVLGYISGRLVRLLIFPLLPDFFKESA